MNLGDFYMGFGVGGIAISTLILRFANIADENAEKETAKSLRECSVITSVVGMVVFLIALTCKYAFGS